MHTAYLFPCYCFCLHPHDSFVEYFLGSEIFLLRLGPIGHGLVLLSSIICPHIVVS